MKRMLMGLVPVVLMLAVIGCGPAIVKDKEMVSISFKGTLADGSVFGQSEKDKPLEFLVGSGKMIPTLEKGLLGLKVGAKKKIDVKAADAYGEYDKAALQTVDRKNFPKDLELKVGATYTVRTPQGPITVTINAITDKTVTVDFNHPLAGKDLTFDIEVLKIRDATKAELAAAFPPAAPAQQPAPGPAQQPAQK
ncbi:MAG: peptidylprolyl isomerase [Spirochaetia bacterium]